MKRVLTILGAITVLEIWALFVFRGHPLVRPEWFSTLLLFIQLLMALGGVQACRWLLRFSPVARQSAPQRDWTKLWLWCGPVGGFLLVKACLLGKAMALYTGSTRMGWIVTAHIAGGAVVWLVSTPWAISDMFSDSGIGLKEKLLMQGGIVSHVLGLAVYFGFFPGAALPPLTILAAVYFFGALLYYLIAVSVCWAFIFRFWTPAAPNSDQEH